LGVNRRDRRRTKLEGCVDRRGWEQNTLCTANDPANSSRRRRASARNRGHEFLQGRLSGDGVRCAPDVHRWSIVAATPWCPRTLRGSDTDQVPSPVADECQAALVAADALGHFVRSLPLYCVVHGDRMAGTFGPRPSATSRNSAVRDAFSHSPRWSSSAHTGVPAITHAAGVLDHPLTDVMASIMGTGSSPLRG
jgi:hypothetical protein